jgi:hypothetical protein
MIVRFLGGLGNQLFQAAFGLSVSAKRNESVAFSLPDSPNRRPYGLNAYVADIKFAPETDFKFHERSFIFQNDVYTAPWDATYIGYWQTEKYFDENFIRQVFVLKNKINDRALMTLDAIAKAGKSSAFLHVRRGDYLWPAQLQYHGVLNENYYGAAINRIRAQYENAHFFIFSDDPDWCRQAFPRFTIVRGNQPYEDIYLMSQCRNAILANSSFSWWGAWLSLDEKSRNERLVIAPKRWFANITAPDMIPDRWTTI